MTLNPLPCPTVNYITYHVRVDVINRGQCYKAYVVSCVTISYLYYLLRVQLSSSTIGIEPGKWAGLTSFKSFGKASGPMVIPSGLQAHSRRMSRVLPSSYVLQVLWGIIEFISILVIDLKPFRARPQKCRRDQSVNCSVVSNPQPSRCNHRVAVSVNLNFKYSPCISGMSSAYVSHSPQITNFINIFKAQYWPPRLVHATNFIIGGAV